VVYIGSNDGNAYALDAGTGAKLWSYGTGGGVDSSPAVAKGVVYFGSQDGNAYALDAEFRDKGPTFIKFSAVASACELQARRSHVRRLPREGWPGADAGPAVAARTLPRTG